jgi:hypothetical protein
MERILHLSDREAKLAKEGKLKAVVRAMKPPFGICAFCFGVCVDAASPSGFSWGCDMDGNKPILNPFGAPGTVLAGKETWGYHQEHLCDATYVEYKASFSATWEEDGVLIPIDAPRWRSPLTMPVWAIRHRFTVKSVRVMQANKIGLSTIRGLGVEPSDFEQIYRITNPNQWLWYAELEGAIQ